MNTTKVETSQTEGHLYEELGHVLGEFSEEERRKVMQHMIRRLKFKQWRNERLSWIKGSWNSAKPAKLWVCIATGALAPVVFFCVFIWVSLWVE
ncbi:hypothetical protein KQI74_13935 [Paenibacillus barcinonensis]|uniref:hypothetical protein n=1 Tax=Paenibacillus TaxID=44249 RepID=UPI001C107766|nr:MULTISPECIES: hypothetical protein [Paenibacillus]MBU5353389.1 hypothetical protein [Paenibacillus barcinonensis]MDM5279649.1 hypothetical protein [Paenibacillus silvae]